jgi:hypothetical protein
MSVPGRRAIMFVASVLFTFLACILFVWPQLFSLPKGVAVLLAPVALASSIVLAELLCVPGSDAAVGRWVRLCTGFGLGAVGFVLGYTTGVPASGSPWQSAAWNGFCGLMVGWGLASGYSNFFPRSAGSKGA